MLSYQTGNSIKLKLRWYREDNLLTAFWYFEFFWSEIRFQGFPKKITQKNGFFTHFLFSGHSLAIWETFETPKWPKINLIATSSSWVIFKKTLLAHISKFYRFELSGACFLSFSRRAWRNLCFWLFFFTHF